MSAAPIPIIDIGPVLRGEPGSADKTAAELSHACRNVGFYYLRGHGVPRALINAVFEQARRFHAQPIEAKTALRAGADNVGYMP